jgi:methylated-DNA-protein-cysteine methyltransferase-like protein
VAAKRNTRPSWEPVFRFVKSIPRGRVISYGELARALRLPGGARTAGRAMAATPRGRGIPWHRVLGAGGRILVREPYAGLQRRLLESEGVRFIEGRVDWKRHAWKKLKGHARIALRSARASVLRFSSAKPR